MNHRALAVSDGSYSPDLGIGTASWCISTQNKENLITAGALSPGDETIQSSYRSELLGLLGILEQLMLLCKQWNIQNGSCTIMCDGITALEIVQHATRESVKTRQSSCDLISACVAIKEMIPIKLHFAHVKGHQDDTVPLSKLSIPAQLNVLMDSIAKNMLKEQSKQEAIELTPHTLALRLPCKKQSHFVRQDFKRLLYQSIMEERAHDYWVDSKNRYKRDDITKIDWTAQTKAMTTLSTTKRRNISKWVSGWTSVGKNMERWNLRYRGQCPFCSYPKETTKHVLMCQHESPTKVWTSLLEQYDKKLMQSKTNYYLRKAIIHELWAWRRNSLQPLPTLLYADETLKEAILEQRQLGWTVFLEGLVTTKIIAYQQAHYSLMETQQTYFNWPQKVIKAGWQIITQLWEHRNKQLHQTHIIEDMEGMHLLNRVIIEERNIGLSGLPMLEFSHLFRLSEEELMKKSTEGKKDWLATVKLARDLYKDPNKQIDEFETNTALRNWIGLKPE